MSFTKDILQTNHHVFHPFFLRINLSDNGSGSRREFASLDELIGNLQKMINKFLPGNSGGAKNNFRISNSISHLGFKWIVQSSSR